jgi:hypothetical protein
VFQPTPTARCPFAGTRKKGKPGPAGDWLACRALDPEQLPLALTFLSGYHPLVFDAVLNAVEPCDEVDTYDNPADEEPFCIRCGDPVGIFRAHGKDYLHYRGVLTASSKPRPCKADHKPLIGWRPARDVPVPASC